MKKLFLPALLLCLAFSGFSAPVDAADSKKAGKEASSKEPKVIAPNSYLEMQIKVHPCTRDDVLGGLWKSVFFSETPQSWHSRLNNLQRHRYMTLNADGHYYIVRAAKEVKDRNMILRLTTPNKKKKVVGAEHTFTLQPTEDEKNSEIIFFSAGEPIYRHRCTIVAKKKAIFEEGDMILNGYTVGGKTLLYEVYRRWF